MTHDCQFNLYYVGTQKGNRLRNETAALTEDSGKEYFQCGWAFAYS